MVPSDLHRDTLTTAHLDSRHMNVSTLYTQTYSHIHRQTCTHEQIRKEQELHNQSPPGHVLTLLGNTASSNVESTSATSVKFGKWQCYHCVLVKLAQTPLVSYILLAYSKCSATVNHRYHVYTILKISKQEGWILRLQELLLAPQDFIPKPSGSYFITQSQETVFFQ